MDIGTDARTRILRAGARIVHRKGFQDAGLSELLTAARVPKGSFYFYFKNKEDFGLALIDFYAGFFLARADEIFDKGDGPYVSRLRAYLDWQGEYMEAQGCVGGCPFGVLSQEMADRNESFRQRLDAVFGRLRRKTARLLARAREAGEIDPLLVPDKTADFILSAWQGTLILMKVAKNGEPRRTFLNMVFDRILAAPPKIKGEAS